MGKSLKKKVQGYNNAMNVAEYENALDAYYANKRNEEQLAKIKDKTALKQYKANEEIRQLKIRSQIDQFDKSQELYETKLGGIDFAKTDAQERVRLGLDEQIAEMAFQYDDLERDMYKEVLSAGQGYDLKEMSLESARLENRVTQEEMKIERGVRRTQFKEQIQKNEIDKKKTTSEYRKQQFDMAIETIQAQGRSRAKGQFGVTAGRAMSTAKALNGINQASLENNLYYSQEALKSQQREIEASRKAELGTDYNSDDFSLKSIKDAASQGGRLGLRQSSSQKKETLTQEQVRSEQKYIADTLGITSEEFEMSRGKLAESLQSAAASAEIKMKNIKVKEFEALGSAYAEKMVAPRFGDADPMPYKTPISQSVMPRPAPKTPMTPGGGGRSMARKSSGFGTAATIGSAALAIGAGFASGGTATALMGASGILGGLGSLFG